MISGGSIEARGFVDWRNLIAMVRVNGCLDKKSGKLLARGEKFDPTAETLDR